jgi:6-phosphogluconate dehydrogenase
MADADIGLIGLAVMGQNLVLNMHDHGFRVAVFNRTATKTQEFMRDSAASSDIIATYSLAELVQNLKRPRRVMLMVKAGTPVDDNIEQLLPLLEPGDIIIDGGNSLYTDSERRLAALATHGILYLGCGISGGEEGARHGPSIMPGGTPAAWPQVQPIFQRIAAQVDGLPCCDWVGEGGAGHYVKMVHNGIEYGDMQLIAEVFQLLQQGLGLDFDALHQTFNGWNQGVLESYLIEISAHIFTVKDSDGAPLVSKILDSAGQKGTGKWTAIDALEQGTPLTLIAEAVFARYLSALKDERNRAAALLPAPVARFSGDVETYIGFIHDALYAAKIISYAQGFMLMRHAAQTYGWRLEYGNIAMLWRGGCIIRSVFLNDIKNAFARNPNLDNLMLDDFFRAELARVLPGWRKSVALAVELGLPVPGLSAALAFYDGYRNAQSPANLIQAQRDYFGAHTYERVDKARGIFFHTHW